MECSNFSIKELKQIFDEKGVDVSDAFLEACTQDSRKAVQALVKKCLRQRAEQTRLLTMYHFEDEAKALGRGIVAGVDEAGRGPLAGPVSVAAVILPEHCLLPKLNDSKKLSAKVRDELYDQICNEAVAYSQIFVDEHTIDRVNILQATMNGMYEAIFALPTQPEQVFIDAVHLEQLTIPQLSIIKGDAKSASIAAASIIAKVSRDRLMDKYDKMYPEYGFAKHKGYGTAEHIEALKKYGPCPIHRKSFEPIRSMIEK